MRTTVDLPQDLHRVLQALATSSRKSFSQTAVELLQRGLQVGAGASVPAALGPARSAVTGLPLVAMPRPVTPEDVRALDDVA